MSWMCLLVGSPKISVHISSRCQWVASSQELMSSYTSDEELFCCRFITEDKLWIYHSDTLNKLEFMQWKNVYCPTFTSMCNSATNWLDYGNSFSGKQTDCLWQTICILERHLLVSIMQNQHSSYSTSRSINTDESCHLAVWLFCDHAAVHKSLVAQQALCNCEFVQKWTILPTVQTWLPVIIF